MKTNTSTATGVQYTLKEAVVEAVKSLLAAGTKSFSAFQITTEVRNAVNEGEYSLPGLENPDTSASFKYLVKNDDVKEVIELLQNDGTLANLGLDNVDYSGAYRIFNFTAPATSTDTTDVADGAATPTTNDDATNDDSPVAQRIKAYIANVGSATAKQIQSTLKVNGVTCKDIVTLADELGFDITVGTEGAYSTYTVA